MNLLGITHVERIGHYHASAHPDVDECSHGGVRLRIAGGRIAQRSLDCPGFARAAMPDMGAMQAL